MKRRSTLLLGLGVAVFVVGAGLVLMSLRQHTAPQNVAVRPAASSSGPVPPVVVATKAMPAGTTGEQLIEQGAVTLAQPPAGAYKSDDLTSVNALTQQALSTAVAVGQPIETSLLHTDATDVTPPAGDESVVVTLSSGPAGVGGYLNPGDQVDIYGNVTKTSSGPGAAPMALPCTTRLATQVPVLDVSQQVAPYRSDKTATGRTAPTSLTVLLAVTPAQATTIIYYQTNESLFLTTAASTPPSSGTSDCPALLSSPELTPAP